MPPPPGSKPALKPKPPNLNSVVAKEDFEESSKPPTPAKPLCVRDRSFTAPSTSLRDVGLRAGFKKGSKTKAIASIKESSKISTDMKPPTPRRPAHLMATERTNARSVSPRLERANKPPLPKRSANLLARKAALSRHLSEGEGDIKNNNAHPHRSYASAANLSKAPPIRPKSKPIHRDSSQMRRCSSSGDVELGTNELQPQLVPALAQFQNSSPTSSPRTKPRHVIRTEEPSHTPQNQFQKQRSANELVRPLTTRPTPPLPRKRTTSATNVQEKHGFIIEQVLRKDDIEPSPVIPPRSRNKTNSQMNVKAPSPNIRNQAQPTQSPTTPSLSPQKIYSTPRSFFDSLRDYLIANSETYKDELKPNEPLDLSKVDPYDTMAYIVTYMQQDIELKTCTYTKNYITKKKYNKCFKAKAAVSWLLENSIAMDEQDAISTCEKLCFYGMMANVVDKSLGFIYATTQGITANMPPGFYQWRDPSLWSRAGVMKKKIEVTSDDEGTDGSGEEDDVSFEGQRISPEHRDLPQDSSSSRVHKHEKGIKKWTKMLLSKANLQSLAQQPSSQQTSPTSIRKADIVLMNIEAPTPIMQHLDVGTQKKTRLASTKSSKDSLNEDMNDIVGHNTTFNERKSTEISSNIEDNNADDDWDSDNIGRGDDEEEDDDRGEYISVSPAIPPRSTSNNKQLPDIPPRRKTIGTSSSFASANVECQKPMPTRRETTHLPIHPTMPPPEPPKSSSQTIVNNMQTRSQNCSPTVLLFGEKVNKELIGQLTQSPPNPTPRPRQSAPLLTPEASSSKKPLTETSTPLHSSQSQPAQGQRVGFKIGIPFFKREKEKELRRSTRRSRRARTVRRKGAEAVKDLKTVLESMTQADSTNNLNDSFDDDSDFDDGDDDWDDSSDDFTSTDDEMDNFDGEEHEYVNEFVNEDEEKRKRKSKEENANNFGNLSRNASHKSDHPDLLSFNDTINAAVADDADDNVNSIFNSTEPDFARTLNVTISEPESTLPEEEEEEPVYVVYNADASRWRNKSFRHIRQVIMEETQNVASSQAGGFQMGEHIYDTISDTSDVGNLTVVEEEAIYVPTIPMIGTLNRLWSNRPDVVQSGILDHMKPKEIKRQETIREFFTTEESYLADLQALTSEFLFKLNIFRQLGETAKISFDVELVLKLLPAAKKLMLVGEKMREELRHRLEENMIVDTICDIVDRHVCELQEAMRSYSTLSIRIQAHLDLHKKEFAEIMEKFVNSVYKGLPFLAYVIVPIQRVARYPLLVNSIISATPPTHGDRESLHLLLSKLTEVVIDCNECMREEENMLELERLEDSFETSQLKNYQKVSGMGRSLVKRGPVTLISGNGKKKLVEIFLLSDLFMYSKPKNKGKTFKLYMQMPRQSIVVIEKPNMTFKGKEVKHLFCVRVNEEDLIFSCESETERTRWISALNEDMDNEHSDNGEFWIVQTIQDYISKNVSEELSFRKGVRLYVVEKKDQYMRGFFANMAPDPNMNPTKWFPASCVKEISSSANVSSVC
eukprot:m.76082 g.76082  ORF g.76082 m.76082 type:complete len:1512 (+) comp8505_c0_seq3:154-4689(+)